MVQQIERMDLAKDFDSVLLKKLEQRSEPGLLYDNEYLTWGQATFEMKTESPFIEDTSVVYRFIIADILVDFYKISARQDSDSQDFNGGEVVETKVVTLAFFTRGEKLAKKIAELLDRLITDVFIQVLVVMTVATTVMITFGLVSVKTFAFKVTAQIIHLYETLDAITLNSKKKSGAVELSFKQMSAELNELHLTFNRVARTINLATNSMSGHQTEHEQA